ncbi:hypothetical protein GPECTOR_41g697 [Gonium pectorale]|uniref:F-box domain-containing protein n=1 Tax=Gonium pectorale TaxID=33097 RepID=A0A150GA67_GONPE|nr:hypothetical protein GPECTOR_41g697 [Gonium pectorale]|eukprot:KXZ46732.1 hypothetical protein GPECTOR_41g697 [Gonium pectorale]
MPALRTLTLEGNPLASPAAAALATLAVEATAAALAPQDPRSPSAAASTPGSAGEEGGPRVEASAAAPDSTVAAPLGTVEVRLSPVPSSQPLAFYRYAEAWWEEQQRQQQQRSHQEEAQPEPEPGASNTGGAVTVARGAGATRDAEAGAVGVDAEAAGRLNGARLPADVLYPVLSRLDSRSLVVAALACRPWAAVASFPLAQQRRRAAQAALTDATAAVPRLACTLMDVRRDELDELMAPGL